MSSRRSRVEGSKRSSSGGDGRPEIPTRIEAQQVGILTTTELVVMVWAMWVVVGAVLAAADGVLLHG